MESKNTTCENWIKVICLPKLMESNVYVIYRENGQEVEVEFSENGIRSRCYKLTQIEEKYFLKILSNGDYKRKNN
jgi:hypothetical protein